MLTNIEIASHPNCPIHILEKLSDDGYSRVREKVALNPNCPEWIKSKFKMIEVFKS